MTTRIHLTGELSVETDDVVIRAADLPGRQGRLAFARLALSPHPVSRDELGELLWPGDLPKSWERDLSAVVSKLRALLGPAGLGEALTSALGCYQIQLPPEVRLDVEEARGNLEAAEVAMRNGDADAAAASASVAANLLRRPFLPGESGTWVEARRSELRQLLLRALDVVVESLDRRGERAEAIRYASELVDLEPFRETAYAALVRLHVSAGNRAEALRIYERARKLLAEELGVSPSAALEGAYLDALKADGPSSTARPHDGSLSSGLPGGTVTLLFTDLVGSTELADNLGAEHAEAVRRIHFALLRDAIATRGGREVKNLGDGLMVAFGASGDAVASAVAIQQSVERHNRSAAVPLGVRVGLHVGEPTVEGGDYFGLPVAIAKRLCDAARGDEILASDLVRALAPSHGFAERRELQVKGVAEPVTVWSVTWEPRVDRALPLPPIANRRDDEFAFVGRAAELVALNAALSDVTGGRGRVVMVAGEPGAGKTRLVAEFSRSAHSGGATVLWGRCEQDAGGAYRPFVEALAHAAGSAEPHQLQAWAGRGASDLARIVPVLAERLPELPAPDATDPEAERERMFEAVRALLAAAAVDRPVILVLEDLHWADHPSLLLLQHLARRPGIIGLLIIGSYRPTELDRAHPFASALAELRRSGGDVRLALEPLKDDDIVLLLGGAPGVLHPERLALAHELQQLTDGNAFFLREVVRHLEETAVINRDTEQWRLPAGLSGLGIPEGVKEVVGRRLSRLDADANKVLSAAAIVGREFDIDVVAAITDAEVEASLDALAPALGAGLLHEVAGALDRFSFDHALVRETLAAELGASRRVRMHRRVAEAVELLRSQHIDAHLAELAHHYAEAAPTGVAGKAIEYCRRAGEQAMAMLAFEDAAAFYDRALELGDEAELEPRERCELLFGLGFARRSLDHPQHADAFFAAADIARALDDADLLAQAALGAARSWTAIGLSGLNPEPSIVRLLEEASARHGATAMGVRLRAYLHTMTWIARRPDDDAEALLSVAREVGDADALCAVLELANWIGPGRGDLETGLERTQELLEISRSIGNRHAELSAHLSFVNHHMVRGERAAAEAAVTEFDRLANDLCLHTHRWYVRAWRAMFATLDGRFDDAEKELAHHLDGLEGPTRDYVADQVGVAVYFLWRDQGRLNELESATRATAEATSFPVHWNAYGLLLHEIGRSSDARDISATDRGVPYLVIMDWLVPVTWFIQSLLVNRLGLKAIASDLYDEGLPFRDVVVVAGPSFACLGSARYGLGLLATTLERWDDAEEHFTEARARNEQLGSPPWVAYTELDHARMLLARGDHQDRDRARALASSARAVAQRLGMARLAMESLEVLGAIR